jgi:tetratricopeptide (TPR) repeat protein
MQEELLLEARRYFGDDPEMELPAVLNLANTLYQLGDLERAAELYERSTSLSST